MGAMEVFERYTYDDYKRWEGDWELIDGVAYSMAPSSIKSHQFIVSEVLLNFRKQSENCEKYLVLSKIDWRIDDYTVVKPDVVFLCEDLSTDNISTTPKIIFEVISPSTRLRDERIKFEIYKTEGVKYYVLIYPKELKAKVYKLTNGEYIKEEDKEVYNFDVECNPKLDFNKVFERLR